jgi:hypothetical protein
MDERLEKALEFSNFLETQNNQKRIFLKQYNDNLIHYVDGHKITVTMKLISFCKSMLELDQESIVLLDDNNTPFNVQDLTEFTRELLGVYTFASRKYLYDYNKIKNNRSVEGLTSL